MHQEAGVAMDTAAKVTKRILLTLALLASASQLCPPLASAQQTLGEIPEGFEHRRESSHFVFVWRQADTTPEEIEAAVALAEDLFARIAAVLGPARIPSKKLIVTFEGDWRPIPRLPTEPPRYPYVDAWGRIHLFRFPGVGGGYLGKLGHEMVHAFRMEWRWNRRRPPGQAFWFVEEGFAEWVALHVEPHSLAFPYYGFPLQVVAGQWLMNHEAPPLRTLVEQHGRLNWLCLPQAYSLRGSFFHYLHDTFGKDALLQLAYSEEELTMALFSKVFGRDFEVLEQDWREQTLTALAATAQGAQLARDYRAQTPVQFMYICQAGQDY
jgi:hypothetical protein